MKKIIVVALILTINIVNAQAFKGKGDTKLNIGMTIQNGGTGVLAAADFGLGENFSIGILGAYLLSGSNIQDVTSDYRFDVKARFNANLASVLNISPKFDVYPGLNLGLKNFGGHLGARYFFSKGLGVFSEVSTPFAKYNKDAASKYNNGTSFNIGVSFNLE